MQNNLIKLFLLLNKVFPRKDHPFNNSKNGVLDLNYTDFEYKNTKNVLDMYSKLVDLSILKNKKILDLWCGWWWKAIFIAKHYDSEVVGVDMNLTFLKEAKEKIKQEKLENLVSFKQEDALNTSFDDEEFDIIIMSDVLEHIPHTKDLFKEINRILKSRWVILFDFAPYYHYFWHHIWDTIRIPWLHLFTSEKFRIGLYKQSVKDLPDWQKRIDLRIWLDNNWQESFTYLNNIKRKDFEKILCEEKMNYKDVKIDYKMLKNLTFLSKIPLLREVFIKHIIWYIKK